MLYVSSVVSKRIHTVTHSPNLVAKNDANFTVLQFEQWCLRVPFDAVYSRVGLSARRPLLRLPLTQNHRRLRRQWCDERRMWVAEWKEVVFTDESRICLQHHDGRIRVWRHRGEEILNNCVMHRHTGPAQVSWTRSQPYFNRIMRDHLWHALSKGSSSITRLNCFPGRLGLSPIENMCSMVAQRLTQVTPPAATTDQLWQRVEAAWSAVPQEHIQSLFESMPRRVAAVISINGGYSGYRFRQEPHFPEDLSIPGENLLACRAGIDEMVIPFIPEDLQGLLGVCGGYWKVIRSSIDYGWSFPGREESGSINLSLLCRYFDVAKFSCRSVTRVCHATSR
ncbi:transposable element Tcb1 transposase [Trichonephila clavipes]|nr:transposable element Tcb1 transposase [Trichonephila clavipes]